METIRTYCGIALLLSFIPLFSSAILSLIAKAKISKKIFWICFGISSTLGIARMTLEFIYIGSAPPYTTYDGEIWPTFWLMILLSIGILYSFLSEFLNKH